MDEKIIEKVREIQHKYCGEPVETKLYYAIEETIDELNSESKPCRDCKIMQENMVSSWCKKHTPKDIENPILNSLKNKCKELNASSKPTKNNG